MRDMLRKPYSWFSLVTILFFALGLAQFAACGDDDDTSPTPTPTGDDDTSPTGDDDTSPTPESQATPTPESQATPTPESQATPTPEPAKVNITFTVDLTIDADENPDTNLNEVKDGEQVFIVGNMNDWDPNDPAMAMTDNGDGTWTITLPLAAGSNLAFKFAKTTSDPEDMWAEGEKDYVNDQDPAWSGCTNDDTKTEGLFEVPNREYTVPDADADAGTFPIDAWRDTAVKDYGMYVCE